MKKTGVVLTGLLVLLTGCRFERHRSEGDNGKNGDVKIATPFGGVSVKSDEKSAQAGVGLTPYPGATLTQKGEDGKNNNAANVNLSFGDFHLGVRALSYQTADAPDKVLAFYRADMAKYGGAILCRGNAAVGQPARTAEGLGCGDSDNRTIQLSGDNEEQLKAGSRLHQHVVSVEAKNGGTRIGLVSLDLPGGLGGDGSKD